MDKIAHTKKYNPLFDKPAFQKKIKEVCEKERWIMEGVYTSTLEYRMPKADMTIYLDFPRRVYIYRIIKRRIQYRNKKREEMPDDWVEKLDPAFMKFILKFHKNQKPRIDTKLEKYGWENIKVMKSPIKLKTFMSELENLL